MTGGEGAVGSTGEGAGGNSSARLKISLTVRVHAQKAPGGQDVVYFEMRWCQKSRGRGQAGAAWSWVAELLGRRGGAENAPTRPGCRSRWATATDTDTDEETRLTRGCSTGARGRAGALRDGAGWWCGARGRRRAQQ